MKLLVIVPFLNEEEHLPTLLRTLEQQTRVPDELLLMDDGSTDASADMAAAFAARHSWARCVRRPPRAPERDRMYSAHELRAFERGLQAAAPDWEIAAKLDGDLAVTQELFAEIERRFAAEPRLGMAGPYISTPDAGGRLIRQRCPENHVEGEASFYRRQCLESIFPLPAILGWDTIDEIRARMRGWHTAAIEIPGGDPVHLRRMGSYNGILRGFRRAGLAAYAYGAHPLHVLLAGIARLTERPFGLCGVSYVAGWVLAGIRHEPRAEPELRAFVRREQRRRLRRLLSARARR
jgi:glycosyltransferase involved in cell wall biosynthesis